MKISAVVKCLAVFASSSVSNGFLSQHLIRTSGRTMRNSLGMSTHDPFASGVLEADDYLAVGVACCFTMDDEGRLNEYHVLEPLTAGTLETIEKGIETSYKRVLGIKCGDFFLGGTEEPTGVNMDALKPLEGSEELHICADAVERSMAAARTFKRRVEAQMVDIGDVCDEYNFNVEKKRILNEKYEPSFDDNVKQDKSIDVYGRDEEDLNSEIEKLANA